MCWASVTTRWFMPLMLWLDCRGWHWGPSGCRRCCRWAASGAEAFSEPGGHQEESRNEMTSVSPSLNAIPTLEHGQLGLSRASPCSHLAASASGHAPHAPSLCLAAAWPLSHGTGWASSRDSLLPSAQGCSLRDSLRKWKGVKTRSSLSFSLALLHHRLWVESHVQQSGGKKR